jgi:hypothetical protein
MRLMSDFHLESEIDKLIQHEVIRRETWDEIKMHSNRTNQLRLFLLKLGSYDATKFESFLDVLKDSHNHIAEELTRYKADTEDNDAILFGDDGMDIPCLRCEISRRVQLEEVIDELFSRGVIGATALRKYIEPSSEFRGSKVWKYVFENLKNLQRNNVNVSKTMREILAKNYRDIADSRHLVGHCSWDCTCETSEISTHGRVYSSSDASSVINQKCATRSNSPDNIDIFLETDLGNARKEKQTSISNPQENHLSTSHHPKPPKIVITANDDEPVTNSEYDDLLKEISPMNATLSDTKHSLNLPSHGSVTRNHQEDVIYKNPCYDDSISAKVDVLNPLLVEDGQRQKATAPSKDAIWQKFFPGTQTDAESPL